MLVGGEGAVGKIGVVGYTQEDRGYEGGKITVVQQGDYPSWERRTFTCECIDHKLMRGLCHFEWAFYLMGFLARGSD